MRMERERERERERGKVAMGAQITHAKNAVKASKASERVEGEVRQLLLLILIQFPSRRSVSPARQPASHALHIVSAFV
jgi:hypothetical protein